MSKSAWPLTKSIFACTIGTLVATGTMFASIYLRKSLMAASFLPPESFISASLGFAVAYAVAVWLCLVLIGLPVQAAMQKERITGYVWHVAPAIIFGAAIFAGLTSALSAFETAIEANDIIRGAGLGFIAASVAWLIRRPDLDNGVPVIILAQPPFNSRLHRHRQAG